MEEFIIEDSIEKKPTILGIKSGFFFMWVAISLLLIFAIFTLRSLPLGILFFLLIGGSYLFFFAKTVSFSANRTGDSKVPTLIISNPTADEQN